MKGLPTPKKHISVTQRFREQCGDDQREKGVGLGGGGQRGEKWGWKETLLGVEGT